MEKIGQKLIEPFIDFKKKEVFNGKETFKFDQEVGGLKVKDLIVFMVLTDVLKLPFAAYNTKKNMFFTNEKGEFFRINNTTKKMSKLSKNTKFGRYVAEKLIEGN